MPPSLKSRPAISRAALSALLTADRTRVRPGERVRFTLTIRNASTEEVAMAGVLDGSESCIRYPHYRVQVAGPPGFVEPAAPPVCGIVAPLLAADMRLLAPGEGFDPTAPGAGPDPLKLRGLEHFPFELSGRYEFWVVVSTQSDREDDWLGLSEYPQKAPALERLRRVPRLRFESNRLAIVVTTGG